MEYENAHNIAENNQYSMLKVLPKKLIRQEDRFFEKIQRFKAEPIKKLEMLYSFMDELSKFISRFTPCKKGCSACCHYKVSVSHVEVRYIEKNSQFQRSINLAPSRNFHGEPCPFLKNDSCSIYEARPFACRKHHAFTPDAYWCEPKRSNDQHFPLLSLTNVDKAFKIIREESNSEQPYDIRQFFG